MLLLVALEVPLLGKPCGGNQLEYRAVVFGTYPCYSDVHRKDPYHNRAHHRQARRR
jgi:hypothetical protein